MGWWLLATASLGCLAVVMIRALDRLDRDHDSVAAPVGQLRARATAARGAAVAVRALARRTAALRERTGLR